MRPQSWQHRSVCSVVSLISFERIDSGIVGQFTSFCCDFNSLHVTQTVSLRRFVVTNLQRNGIVSQQPASPWLLSSSHNRKLTVCFTWLLVTQTVSLRRFVVTNLQRNEIVSQQPAGGRFLSFGCNRKLTVCFTLI